MGIAYAPHAHTARVGQLTVGPHALRITGLYKAFRAGIPGCTAHAQVLRGATLLVQPGEIVGIAGSVGTGKTTLLLCAAGLLRPDAGHVSAFGRSVPGGLVSYVALPGTLAATAPSPTQALARALATGSPILLLDGLLPFLSPGTCKVIDALAARGMTVVIADRDHSRLEHVVHRTLTLHEGALHPSPPHGGSRRLADSHRPLSNAPATPQPC